MFTVFLQNYLISGNILKASACSPVAGIEIKASIDLLAWQLRASLVASAIIVSSSDRQSLMRAKHLRRLDPPPPEATAREGKGAGRELAPRHTDNIRSSTP